MKAVLREKLIALSASKKKFERAYTRRLTEQLKALEQKELIHPGGEVRKLSNSGLKSIKQKLREPYKESTKPEAGSLKKINKIDKPLARLTKGLRDSIQINKIRNEKGDITSETDEILKFFSFYY